MKFLNTLASYVPSIILDQLQEQGNEPEVPFRKAYETVVVFCDISGFTKLSEFMAKSGKGSEGVARNLNKYFQMMVKIISSGGGDVLKFAGDAMIVLWPEDDLDSIETRLHRATQCAVYIQQKLDQVGPRALVARASPFAPPTPAPPRALPPGSSSRPRAPPHVPATGRSTLCLPSIHTRRRRVSAP